MGDLDRAAVIAEYRRLHPTYSPSDVFFAATTDSRSWRGQVIEAERRAAQPKTAAPTWVYQLDWRTPIDGGKWGAHHGLDVPLVFDNAPLVPEKVGTGPDAQRVADQMSETWIAFARTGRPDSTAHPGLADLRPRAPRDDGVRRAIDGRRRSARRRAADVRAGALRAAGNVG